MIRRSRDRQIIDVVTGQVEALGSTPGSANEVAAEEPAARDGRKGIESDGEENDGDE